MINRKAGRSKISLQHSRVVSSKIGKLGYFEATDSRSAARCRCCHSGVRWPGRRRGNSRARAAASLNRAAKAAVPGSAATTSDSTSSGSGNNNSMGRSSAASGKRTTMPSSDQSTSAPKPSPNSEEKCASRRVRMMVAQGAWTREPNGEWIHTRQSPISSRKRSTSSVRSEGIAPVA